MQPQLHNKILYTPNGKPEIPNSNLHISISHNRFFSAVLLSNINCGIDTEPITYKAEKIKHKFLSTSEIELLNNISLDKSELYTFAWCIKESIFKWYGKGNVLFKENIEINNMLLHKNVGEAEVIFKKQNEENKNIRLHLQKIDNCAFAYTL
jgi:phosphopantetheinyl transferase